MQRATSYNDLALVPNMQPAEVEFVFDEPRSYPSKRDPSRLRYAFKLKLLTDPDGYRQPATPAPRRGQRPGHAERLLRPLIHREGEAGGTNE
jgi:hypothetical protein